MLVRVTLVIEILAIIIGIYRTYSQKVKIDIYSMVLFVMMLVVLELVNFHSIDHIYSNLNILFVFLYCIFKFKEKISHTIVSCGLALVVITIIQFLCGIVVLFIPHIAVELKNFISNFLSLLVIIFILPLCNLNYLRTCVLRKNWVVCVVTVFISFVFFCMLFQRKSQGGINIESFIFTVPSVIIILLMITLWDRSVVSEKRMENDLNMMLSMQENYDELVEQVRINQHGIKNHLSAMISSHYSYKAYEQFIKEQEEYCGIINHEGRYNNLLKIKNHTLGGFLYGKMQEIESYEINLEYNVEAEMTKCGMPNYYIVEMLGILFDNAIEACKGVNDSAIYWSLYEQIDEYVFLIRNTYQEVKYKEIEEWFKPNETTKGTNRGIGLYRIIQICNEWNCDIIYSSETIEDRNWIVFKIIIRKRDEQ